METRPSTHVPALHRRHLRRPRLTRLLDATTAQSIILIAPAGYGKTLLVSEWLEGRTDVAWYRATPASADLAALSAGISDMIEQLVPGAGHRLRQRIRVGETPEKSARPLAELLAEDLAGWPDSAWLVLDDYHLVLESAPVEEFMDWLLTLASSLRVIVTTRRRPTWATARRVLYGEVHEIGRERLAMTNDEAARVLGGHPVETVNAIVSQAQGWPALLGLAALSSSPQVPTERVSEELFRYFAEEVFREAPPAMQRFMLVAALPQTIGPKVVREVLDLEEPEETLERLLDEGLLQDAGRDELAFHPLLREFLRRKLESEHPELAASLAEKVISHARSTGRWEEAFDLAVHREHLDEAAEIIGEASTDLLATGRIETLETWLDICGPIVLTLPSATLAQTHALLRRGQLYQAATLASVLTDDQAQDPAIASRAWAVRGYVAHFLSDALAALDFHLSARRLANQAEHVVDSTWDTFIAAISMEHPDRKAYLEEFRSLAPSTVDTHLRLAVGDMLTAQLGDSSLAGRDYDYLLPAARRARDPRTQTSFLGQFSYVSSLQGNYERGLALALEAERMCRAMRLTVEEKHCLIARAFAEIGLRRFREARATITDLYVVTSQIPDPYLILEAAILEIKLVLSQGGGWEGLAPPDPPPSHYTLMPKESGELLALRAAAAAATQETARARSKAQLAREATSSVEAKLTSYLAELLTHGDDFLNAQASADSFTQFIESIAESGQWDSLVLAYRIRPRILVAVSRQAPHHHARVTSLLRSSGDVKLATSLGLHALAGPDLEKKTSLLTPREFEVLSLIVAGFANEAIARHLVISRATAKVHVHHILQKLGAKSRLQAALLARDLLDPHADA